MGHPALLPPGSKGAFRAFGLGVICLASACGGGGDSPSPKPPDPIEEPPPSAPSRALSSTVSVLTWKHGAQAALTLTFDDGTQDHAIHVLPILQRHQLHGTFNPPSNTTGSGTWVFASWAQIGAIHAAGNEIGSHSVTHPHLTQMPEGSETEAGTQRYELAQAKAAIESHIPGPCVSFAYPYSEQNAALEGLVGAYYASARTGMDNPANPVWNPASAPAWNRLQSYAPQFPASRPNASADDAEQARVRALLTQAMQQQQWAILMNHAVLPFDQIAAFGGYETQSTQWLESLCGWIASKRDTGWLWPETQGRITRYVQERDALQLGNDSSSDTQIQFELGDGLEDARFDEPLSLEVKVPAAWTSVRLVKQDGSQATLTPSSTSTVRFEATPDRGPVTLSRP